MKLVWVPEAVSDLHDIYQYIAERNPDAARQTLERIHEIVETHLARTPTIGREGRVTGTRELIIPGTPFVVPYRVKSGAIEILRVYHAARRFPSSF
ncbi:MAG: type II toxin-antitoxin system RelE/ParE family toxin [Sneathiella sp.]|nr:type II toxin-antitoxin system RelE/ParE family toxin [Sneathiella sp.]